MAKKIQPTAQMLADAAEHERLAAAADARLASAGSSDGRWAAITRDRAAQHRKFAAKLRDGRSAPRP